MNTSSLRQALMAASILALAPAAALAQDDVKERAAEIAEQANDVQQQAGELANEVASAEARDADADVTNAVDSADGNDRDDDGFDWGLLGLLGLAGLLGLKGRDRDGHVGTDGRRDTRL